MTNPTRTNGRFPALTAAATLLGLLLFLGLGLLAYREMNGRAEPQPDPLAKREAVAARNQVVLDGQEPGTRPMAEALPEFVAKQKAGAAPFPARKAGGS